MIDAAPIELASGSPDETRRIGHRLGRTLSPGDVVLLNGDLGAGKTTFAQGIALGLGISNHVQSPTFTLVAEHAGTLRDGRRIAFYHLDLYRLRDESELESFGYDQFLAPADGVSVIEWPERAGVWLPDAYLLVDFTPTGPGGRSLRIVAVNRPLPDLTPDEFAEP